MLAGGFTDVVNHDAWAQDVSLVGPVPHPRLFFTSEDVSALRQQAATTHTHIWHPIQEFAQFTLAQIPHIRTLSRMPCEHTDDSRSQYGDVLIPLAFSYLITGNSAYADAVKTALSTYNAWPSWGLDGMCDAQGVNSDLTFAHLLFGSSIAYDWLYDQFTPEEHAIITQALIRRARELYEASAGIENPTHPNAGWWRNTFVQYHHMVNIATLGLAALALEGETRDAQTWLEQAVRHARLHQGLLQGIADGTWHEGTMFQTYMLGMSLPFLWSLREIKGLDMMPHKYYRAFSEWMIYNWLPETTQSVISHGSMAWGYPLGYQAEILSFLVNEYRDTHAQWLLEQMEPIHPRTSTLGHAPWYVFEFLFHDQLVRAASPQPLPESKTFEDLSGVIWRTGWGAQDLVFGLKTGAYGGRFAHETFINTQYPWNTNLSIDYTGEGVGFRSEHDDQDINTFSLWKGNIQLTGELAGRSDHHLMYGHTSVHNTILIDGKGQVRPPGTVSTLKDSDGKLEAVYIGDNFNYLISDAVNCYRAFDAETNTMPRIAHRLKRHVLFVKPSYVIMVDDIAADDEHEYAWVAHFSKGAWLEGKWIRGESLVYEYDRELPGQRSYNLLGVYVLNPDSFRVVIGVDDPAKIAEAEGRLAEYRHQQVQFRPFIGKPYIHVLPRQPVNEVQFVHILYPTVVLDWSAKPEILSLGIDQQAAGIRVLLNGTQDHIINYGEQNSIVRDTYALNGDVASVLKDASGAITAIFLGNGTTLADLQGTRQLIVTDTPATVDVTYDEPWVRISGQIPDGTTVTVYSPQFQDATVNGQYVDVTRLGEHIQFTMP